MGFRYGGFPEFYPKINAHGEEEPHGVDEEPGPLHCPKLGWLQVGYIAREDESLDWLLKYEGFGDNGYAAFYETVGTILLGRRTHQWILSNVPSEFAYPDKIWLPD